MHVHLTVIVVGKYQNRAIIEKSLFLKVGIAYTNLMNYLSNNVFCYLFELLVLTKYCYD